MRLDGRKISVSLATFEFKPLGTGARLIMTEQVAFFDGHHDNGSRERGSRDMTDMLSAYLEGPIERWKKAQRLLSGSESRMEVDGLGSAA